MLKYEKIHLDAENRRTGKYLEVLHPEYEEFGQSGKRHRKKDFMENGVDFSIYEIEDFEVVVLSAESRLCKYVLYNKTEDVRTNRSSVWVLYEGDWKLIFHQGTYIEK